MADRIVVLRDGRIEQVGAPLTLYNDPSNLFVASFLGAPRMNFSSGKIAALSDGATVEVAGLPPVHFKNLAKDHGLTIGDDVTIGIRPEHVTISPRPDDVTTTAKVLLTEKLGRETVLYADAGALRTVGSDTGTEDVTLILGEGHTLDDATEIQIGFDPANAYLFGPDERTVSMPKTTTSEDRK